MCCLRLLGCAVFCKKCFIVVSWLPKPANHVRCVGLTSRNLRSGARIRIAQSSATSSSGGGRPKPIKFCKHESLAWTQLQIRHQGLPAQLVQGQSCTQPRRAEPSCSLEAAHSSCLVVTLAGRASGEYMSSLVCPYSTMLYSTPSNIVNTMNYTGSSILYSL